MKILLSPMWCVVAWVAFGDPEPGIPYFTNVREVSVSTPDHQNYLVVDQDIWSHAHADLGDLRLYDGASQVPYELRAELTGTSSQEMEVKIIAKAKDSRSARSPW